MFVFFAYLAWALSVNDTAYENQREMILAIRPSVSPSLEYPLQVIIVMAASSLWTWVRKRESTHVVPVPQTCSDSRGSVGDMCLFTEDGYSTIEP